MTSSPFTCRPAPAIELAGVGVRYRLPRGGTRSIKEFALLGLRGRLEFDELWAVRDVDLEVFPGERLGVVGRNGAGKTTLLRVLARVIAPSAGAGTIRGSVVPLLDLGTGFDQDLTGRENAILNGVLLGMRRAELVGRLDEIVQFAELEAFIDLPLRTYSAGMVARLGFAVATAVEPDVLLIDEVLSAGDEGFRARCEARLRRFSDLGTTMVVVSHDPEFVLRECTRAIWVEAGQVRAEGRPEAVLAAYHRALAAVGSPVLSGA